MTKEKTAALKAKETVALKAKEGVAPRAKEPVALRAKEPVALRVKEPVALRGKEPVALRGKEPAALRVKEPVALRAKEKDKDAYKAGDFVVYPTHGVGRVVGIESQEIAGTKLQLIAINFDKDRMILRVPVTKAKDAGLRRLSTRKVMETALTTLKGRSRVKRAMWSRRAQEYEAKINSGDPVSIAEVIRDLHRNADQPDQSYSERQIYQAAVEDIDEAAATKRLEQVLKAA